MAVAILGAGILGACTALELADRGHDIVIFERNAEPMCEASLYNEGKLHLGFVYAADYSFRTAEKMIRGTTRFMDILRRWIPQRVLHGVPSRPFDYVVHRDTMVGIPEIETHFTRISKMLGESVPGRPEGCSLDSSRPVWRRLDGEELASRYNPHLVEAAYET
jgi:nucleoside-diphosphate-sugar epimerase